MAGKDIRSEIRHALQYYMKRRQFVCISNAENLDGCKRVEETSQFNVIFIKCYKLDSDIRNFYEVHVQYPERLLEIQNYLTFSQERMKTGEAEKLLQNLCDKKINH